MPGVLVFVEDPGAVNGIVGLADASGLLGIPCALTGAGHAIAYAADLGVTLEPAIGSAAELLDRLKPDAVLVGTSENPDSLGLALIDDARTRGIPAVGFVDGPSNAERRFKGRGAAPFAHQPDWLLVPEALTGGVFSELGFDPARIRRTGHPHVDRIRARAVELAAEPPGAVHARLYPGAGARPVLLFLAELSDGLDPQAFRRGPGYTLAGRGGSDMRTDICLEEVLDALPTGSARPYVVLRLHPKNDPADFTTYAAEVDLVQRGGDPAAAVHGADLVVGMTSILLMEAAVMERPTLAVTPRQAEADWLAAIPLGLVRHVSTRDDLRSAMAEALAHPNAFVADDAASVLPSGAAGRMAAALAAIAAGTEPAEN